MIRKVYRIVNMVYIEIETAIGFYITIQYERNSEMDAQFLVDSISKKKSSVISEIKELAYNDGWKDKSSKKNPKRTYFSPFI